MAKKKDGFGPEEESAVRRTRGGVPSRLLKREAHRPGMNYSQKIHINYSRTPKR